jgi:saccharopine dehydrogenase-like NADP-dependent oxidoreductase
LFSHYWHLDVPGMSELEAYPNRDSLPYADLYGLGDIPTMFRGTLRNKGWCDTLKAIVQLGYTDTEELDWTGKTWADLARHLVGHAAEGDVRHAVATRLKIDVGSPVLERMAWLGLFSEEPLPLEHGGVIDLLTARMLARMPYAAGERDMIILHHEFVAEYAGDRREEITSTLIDYGIPDGDSSMSRTVGLPVAIGSRMILEGRFTQPGVWVPVIPDLYNPILDELETLGIKMEESTRALA